MKGITSASLKEKLLVFFLVSSLFTGIFLIGPMSAPASFVPSTTIRIEKGAGLSGAAQLLKDHHYIRSPFLFKMFVVLSGRSRSVIAGDYYFDHKENSLTVANRVTAGDYDLVEIKVTIPEGLSASQTADILKEKFSLFKSEEFVQSAPEGYLFPDTYFFFPNVSTADVIEVMNTNFNRKIKPLRDEIASSSKNFADIIIMASIVEEEAKVDSDRPIVAGILWNRLSIDMPLQVDASFSYVNGKNTYTLTKSDLKDDSPYNTYLYKGLPPTPIASPSIKSIEAALRPTKTDYLYFLSDLAGNMYYAKDFDGHQRNREKYLRK